MWISNQNLKLNKTKTQFSIPLRLHTPHQSSNLFQPTIDSSFLWMGGTYIFPVAPHRHSRIILDLFLPHTSHQTCQQAISVPPSEYSRNPITSWHLHCHPAGHVLTTPHLDYLPSFLHGNTCSFWPPTKLIFHTPAKVIPLSAKLNHFTHQLQINSHFADEKIEAYESFSNLFTFTQLVTEDARIQTTSVKANTQQRSLISPPHLAPNQMVRWYLAN